MNHHWLGLAAICGVSSMLACSSSESPNTPGDSNSNSNTSMATSMSASMSSTATNTSASMSSSATASSSATSSSATGSGGATGSVTNATNATSTTGAAGSGGAGAGGVTATGTVASTSGGVPADAIIVEDFEDGTVGMQPAGWDNFIAWVANGSNPNGEDLALVDNTQAHGGSQSLHFHGGQNPAQLTQALPQGTNRLYVRAYVMMSRQLGNIPTSESPNHETLIAIRGTPGGANDEVRFGEIKGAIGTNEVPSDNIAPVMEQWNSGPSVPANTWACIEVAFLGDESTHQLQAWVDGTLVHSITDPSTDFQNGAMPANWLNGKFTELVLGWHSFSSATADVWMDDLVVALSPIGCN